MSAQLLVKLLIAVALLTVPSVRLRGEEVDVDQRPLQRELSPETDDPLLQPALGIEADDERSILQQSYRRPLRKALAAAREHFPDSESGHDWRLLPRGLVYRTYLASAQESRLRSVWNDENGAGNIWDITLGGHAPLLRYGTSGNSRPKGFQLGMEGAGQVRLDIDEERDVIATDYRFGIPLTWGNEHYQIKTGYYHVSSHLGDEFLLKNPGYPRLNFSRDALVYGLSLTPWEWWRVYSELGYAFRADVTKEWEVLFGIEYAPSAPTGFHGAPFLAANGHLREEVDYGGNFVFQTGWAWRSAPASGLFRMGVEYYNGKNDQFSFYDDSEQKIGFGIWYDY